MRKIFSIWIAFSRSSTAPASWRDLWPTPSTSAARELIERDR